MSKTIELSNGIEYLYMIDKNIQIKGCACIKSILNYRFACIQHLIIKQKPPLSIVDCPRLCGQHKKDPW